MSGCATLVSRIRSASHSVPAATRSTPAASLYDSIVALAPSSSSQGARKPGVCEPCPGATTTITRSILSAASAEGLEESREARAQTLYESDKPFRRNPGAGGVRLIRWSITSTRD